MHIYYSILVTANLCTWIKKQSLGEVLPTFLALYIIIQLFWIVRTTAETKLVSYGPFKVAIVTNICMCLKFKVARTPQFAVHTHNAHTLHTHTLNIHYTHAH